MKLEERLALFKNIPDEKADHHILEISLKDLRGIEQVKIKIYDAVKDEMVDATQQNVDMLFNQGSFAARQRKVIRKITELGMLSHSQKLKQIEDILDNA